MLLPPPPSPLLVHYLAGRFLPLELRALSFFVVSWKSEFLHQTDDVALTLRCSQSFVSTCRAAHFSIEILLVPSLQEPVNLPHRRIISGDPHAAYHVICHISSFCLQAAGAAGAAAATVLFSIAHALLCVLYSLCSIFAQIKLEAN